MQRFVQDICWSGTIALVVGLVVCLTAATSPAAILLPSDWDGTTQTSGAMGSTDQSPAPVEDLYEDSSDECPQAPFLTPNSPSGGSSSGASSAGGSGVPGSFAILSTASVSFGVDLFGWTLSERRFALPMPRGNDLLRPPQCC